MLATLGTGVQNLVGGLSIESLVRIRSLRNDHFPQVHGKPYHPKPVHENPRLSNNNAARACAYGYLPHPGTRGYLGGEGTIALSLTAILARTVWK
jgi:hypothetical protein